MSKSKVFTGVIWASVQRFGTMIISFVTNIVLARLLTPDDFGAIGMLMLFLAIANTFVDSGFGSALIQKKDANQKDFSTVFFINLGMSVVVYALLFFGAPWVSRFYDLDLLRPLLRAQGLVLILHAFSIIQTALLRKKMDFRKLSICNLIGNLVGSVVGIGAALMGYGVWSLVIRTLTVGLVTSILLWIIGKWKPLFIFSKQSFKELFGFGGFMLLSSIVTTLSNNVQTLIIGKLFSAKDLGNYNQAHNLRNLGTQSVSDVIAQVLYPDFSNNQTDSKQITDKLNNAVYLISYVVAAIMSLCVVIAKPLVLFLFGEKWLECVVPFQILCCGGVFLSVQDINYYVIAAKGKSKPLFFFNVAKLILSILMMLLGYKIGGLFGLLWSMVLISVIIYMIYSELALHFLKAKRKQYVLLLKSIGLNIIIGVVCYLLLCILPDWSNIVLIIIVAVTYLLLLVFVSYVLRMIPFFYLRNNFQNLIGNLRKRNR
jgi:O-antigen/teichoic acid export membrane protein